MSKKERNKRYRESHKEEIKIYKSKYREFNKDKITSDNKEYHKKYYKLNKDKFNKKNKKYRELNKDKVKKSNREYYNKKKEKDFLYRFKKNVRSLILGSIKSNGFNKTTKTAQILGCTIQEFKEHIEKQFAPWMNWNNYGVYKTKGERTWQIDHKIPSSSAKTIEDVIKLNHYFNLRPLCSKENLDKGNKLI